MMDDFTFLVSRGVLVFEYGVIFFALAINSVYFVLMVMGHFILRRERDRVTETEKLVLSRSPLMPRVAILAPAYNEAATIRDSVRAMLNLNYPDYEVVVINDGSKDETLALLVEEFHLCKSTRALTGSLDTKPIRGVYESRDPIPLTVIDKTNGGKADSLNAGLNAARAPLVAAVDADSLLDPDSLALVVRPFLADPERVIASSGTIRAANGCHVQRGRVAEIVSSDSLVVRFQTIEYLRAFLGSRIALSFMNALMVISGAFGVFRRDRVLEAGGFRTSTIGEDMELVVRLHRLEHEAGRDYRIVYLPEPVCWTEVPETLEVLGRQRVRWARGCYESLVSHREMFGKREYGSVGMFGAPYFAFFEMLGPVVELAGYFVTLAGLLLGLLWVEIAVLFLISSVVYGMFLSVGAVVLEETTLRRYSTVRDGLRLIIAAVCENLGYRQLTAWWRCKGLYLALRGTESQWGVMVRKGFQTMGSGSRA